MNIQEYEPIVSLRDSLEIISQADASEELRRIGVVLGMDEVRSASQFVVEALLFITECDGAEEEILNSSNPKVSKELKNITSSIFA